MYPEADRGACRRSHEGHRGRGRARNEPFTDALQKDVRLAGARCSGPTAARIRVFYEMKTATPPFQTSSRFGKIRVGCPKFNSIILGEPKGRSLGNPSRRGRRQGGAGCKGLRHATGGAKPLSLGRVKRGRGLAKRRAISRPLPADFARSGAGVRRGDWALPSAICGLPRSRAFSCAAYIRGGRPAFLMAALVGRCGGRVSRSAICGTRARSSPLG